MGLFKKSPAAIRKDGYRHVAEVVIILVLAFIPYFSLAPIFAEMGMGFLFFEDEESREFFNEFYADYTKDGGYFAPVISPFYTIKSKLFVTALIQFGLIIWVLKLYKNLVFRDRFAPFLIHPRHVKKSKLRVFRDPKLLFKEYGGFFYSAFGLCMFLVLYDPWGYRAILLLHKLITKFEPEGGMFFVAIHALDLTAKFLLPYCSIWLYLSSIVTWKIITESKAARKQNSLGRQMARWGGVGSYIEHDFDEVIKRNKNDFVNTGYAAPIFLGSTTFATDPKLFGRMFGLNTDNHMLTVAQTGAGKSRDVLHTNMALWPHGMFVLDPKGEHAQRIYKIRKAAGFPTYIIDPYGLATSVKLTDCLNPLAEIDPNSPSAYEDIMTIAEACIPSKKDEGKGDHFRETARTLLAGIIAHVLTRYPEEEQTLPTIFDLYLSGKPGGKVADRDGFYKVLAEMAGNKACGKLPNTAYRMLDDAGKQGEQGSIFTTFMRSISWTQSKAITHVLSKSTFSLDDLKNKKATVFLVLPFGYMESQARWIRTILGLCFKRAEFPREKPTSDHKTLYILDEFLQLENCKAVEKAFPTLRGAGVKLWLLMQSLADLQEYYPNHKTMVGACDLQIFGTDEDTDLEFIQNMLGEYENIIPQGPPHALHGEREVYPLCAKAGVAELIAKAEPGDGYQIVKPAGELPVVLNLLPCKWVLNKNRFGDFNPVFVEPYEEEEEAKEEGDESISVEDMISRLKGEYISPKKPITKIPPLGEKTRLRKDIDKLRKDLQILTGVVRNLTNGEKQFFDDAKQSKQTHYEPDDPNRFYSDDDKPF